MRTELGRFKKKHIPWNKKDKALTICLVCKKPFKVYHFLVGKRKYCSRFCYFKSMLGHSTSKQTRVRIGKALSGGKRTKKTIEKMRRAATGRRWSSQQKKKFRKNHSGSSHYNWKGGRRKDKTNGYIVLYKKGKHPLREHRVVAEKLLGRKLKKGEIVHHINGIPDDNRPKNLRVFKNNNEHLKFHSVERRKTKRENTSANIGS